MKLNYLVVNNKYNTVNQVLKEEFCISSRLLTKLIKNKKILLNGNFKDTRTPLKLNDVIDVLLDEEEDNSNIKAANIKLDIIYEDEGLVIINKPAGIAVHPSIRHYSDNLASGVKAYFNKIGLKKRIRPINRLDINTSGLVIFAKNEYIQECLIRQMKNKIFKKEYICFTFGIFENKEGIIDFPIARKKGSIIERCVDTKGQKAITKYEVINESNNYSFVKCILETGRTHQIRVHMAHIGHPILGDTLYGKKTDLIDRQALHCYKITFNNPITKKVMQFKTEIPEDLKKLKINYN